MNAIPAILLLTFLQFLAGFGLLTLLQLKLKPGLLLPLALITGIGILSLLPFLLQLLFIPITRTSVFLSILMACGLLNLHFPKGFRHLRSMLGKARFRIRLYEIPFLLLASVIVLVSVWRCYYYPPTPRDLTSGPEVIAEYTVKEKTLVNSVFSVNLESTNNQFKPPYLTCLQVIYKYAGFPFGQLWLSTLFLAFLLFLYQVLVLHVHRLIAWMLLLIFLAIPEMYAYTFMALFDYSNAVFFFLSLYYLIGYLDKGTSKYLVFSGLLMGLATYVRSETLVLAILVMPLLLWYHLKSWHGGRRIGRDTLFFLLPSLLLYLLSVSLYIHFYLPVSYDVEGLINKRLWDLRPLFTRFLDMNGQLIFGDTGIDYYGYFFYVFFLILVIDAVYTDRWKRPALNWLYAVAVVYFGLPLLGYLLPLLDLDNSTKRGLFKIFPLLLLYLGHSDSLNKLSERIANWEASQ